MRFQKYFYFLSLKKQTRPGIKSESFKLLLVDYIYFQFIRNNKRAMIGGFQYITRGYMIRLRAQTVRQTRVSFSVRL